MSVEKEVYMDKFKKTMVKSLAVILILAMCLGFAACEPKDDTVYQFEEAIDLLSGLTPLEMTFQLISQNMFYGMLMAIPTALIVMRKKKNE